MESLVAFAAGSLLLSEPPEPELPEDELLAKAKELAVSLAGKNRNALNAMKVMLWGDVAKGLGVEPD